MSETSMALQRAGVLSAGEIMRRELLTLSPGDDVIAAVGRLLEKNISGAPVVDDDGKFLGVFSEKCCIASLTRIVAAAGELGLDKVRVREFMTTKLLTLRGDADVFETISHLLAHRISGAPVVDDAGRFRGIFSEKTAMRVLSAALHDGLPGANVECYMNVDRNRIIDQRDRLIDVARKFETTPYRRLPVLEEEVLIGQVSRRDVLRAERRVAIEVISRIKHAEPSDSLKSIAEAKTVGDVMDHHALTAPPTTDLLGIAQMFLSSPYRRLPILDGDRLVGQISRRDLLAAAIKYMDVPNERPRPETLYLSGRDSVVPASLG